MLLWYPISEASVQSQDFMSSAGCWPIVRVLGRHAQKWARVTKNKTVRAEGLKRTIYGRLGRAITVINRFS